MDDVGGLGQQITGYAEQVADINRQISSLPRASGGLLPDDQETYGRLKARREALSGQATALSEKAKRAGAAPIDFGEAVKKASATVVPAVKTPDGVKVGQLGDNHDTVQPDAPEKDRGFVDPAAPNTVLSREEAAAKVPQADANGDGKLHSEEVNTSAGLPARKDDAPIEAESADGVIHEFPAGTPDEVVDRVMKQYAQEMQTPLAPQAPGERRPEGNTRPEPTEKDLPPEAAAMRPGTTSLVSGGAARVNAEDAFKEREAYEKDLRARGVDPKTDPKYRELLQKQAQGQAQDVEETAGYAGLGGAKGAAGLAGRGLAKLGGMVKDAGKVAIGTTAKDATRALQADVASRASSAAGAEEQTAAAAAKRAEELKAQQTQLEQNQPGVAAQRAEVATAPPKQGQTAGLEPERVVAKTREKVADLEKQYVEAGATKEEAARLAEEHQLRIEDAEKAVETLDQELLAKPGASADELGGKLRSVTEDMHEKYTARRSELSGYGKALADAGDELRVNTQGTRALIDENLKDIRNPSLQRVLNGVKDLLTTEKGEVVEEGLSMRAAESLRKYINGVIQSKVFGDQAVDRETLHVLGEIKKSLDAQMLEYEPFAAATKKWAELSRPLDIVERKGALKKVLDKDPVSTDYALTDAQVVGQVINKAKAGSPTLSRLVEENPAIRIPARLYFTQELFGKQAVPTVASLRTFLKQYEQPLRQLGLYDEFRDIRVAKETAQKAVEQAKGAAKETMAQAKVAERQERQVAAQLKRAESVRDAAKKRAEGAAKQPTAEERQAQSAKRAEEGSKRLAGRRGEAEKTQEKAAGAADTYRRFETEINTAVDKAVPTKTREFIGKLRRDGKIDDATYGELLKKIDAAVEARESTAAMRKRMRTIGYVALASAGAPYVYRKLSDLIP